MASFRMVREHVSSACAMRMNRSTEDSLGQLEAVQARLAQNERNLQQEITSLQDELRKEQDPSRMQLIQEMISVRRIPCY